MKKSFLTGILTLIILLSVAYFTYSLNKEYVNLRYTLSDKIPTKLIETSPSENVQQLVVKNTGNIPATQIQIKVNGLIKDYYIIKNSINDEVKEYNSNGHFEATYPSLPPDSQFTYILKTSDKGINIGDIEIKHNRGRAKEALANDNQLTNIIENVIYWSLIILFFLLNINQFRLMMVDSLESRGNYSNYYDYLNKKKPIYVSTDKWDSIRKDYINEKMNRYSSLSSLVNIEELSSYKTLNQDKPILITDNEWELLINNVSNNLEGHLNYLIKTSNVYDSSLDKFFLLKKPKHFQESKWRKIVNKFNENYVSIHKLSLTFHDSVKNIFKELKRGMPSGMLPEYWDQYKSFLSERYYELIYSYILEISSPLKYLKETDLSILGKKSQESIENIAYKIQLLNFDQLLLSYNAKQFLEQDRPDWIKDRDYDQLKKKAEDFIALEKKMDKVSQDESHLVSEIEKTSELKDKVLKQLSIIDNILKDPTSINKIESYDNPFSEGNFSNLKKLSESMTELKNKT